MKNILMLLALCFVLPAWADCTFNVTNYSDTLITVQAGFYHGESVTFKVGIASANTAKLKNNLSCNATSVAGFGITYINLIGKQSDGGWVYLPATKMIKAIGASSGSQDMVVGIAPDGEKLVLFNNSNPDADSFDVRIEKAGRNISRQMGSMN